MKRCDPSLRISRAVVAFCATAILPLAVRADVTYSETGGDNPVTVIRMTVTPAAEPVPALAKRLVVREIDLEPGNAAPYYYRATVDLQRTMERVRKDYDEERDRWCDTGTDAVAIGDLPLQRVREAVRALNERTIWESLATATMRRGCDWELGVEQVRGVETLDFMLPEFQNFRGLTRILALRTRLAIAEGRYDDAIDAMRMNYRLAGDTARVPFIVCSLIGIAQASVTNGTVIELVAAPNSPNLYWALAELPQPLVDTRQAIRFEMDFPFRIFPFLHDAETADHSPEEWNRLLTEATHQLNQAAGGDGPILSEFGAGLAATGLALAGYPYAKEQLIAQGMTPERVERMAVGQVMAIYTERNVRRLTDAYEKLWYMPYWEMRKRSDAVEKKLQAAVPFEGGANREVIPIASMLLPAVSAVRTAQVRMERDMAALRVVEALRMHAAGHDGRLPASLADVDEVPVPLNPATGQPFDYHLDGETAVLTLPVSDGIPGYTRRYEITIAQQTTR